jgi:hypothetical protein
MDGEQDGVRKEKEIWRSEQEWSKEGNEALRAGWSKERKGDMESRNEVRYERKDEKRE